MVPRPRSTLRVRGRAKQQTGTASEASGAPGPVRAERPKGASTDNQIHLRPTRVQMNAKPARATAT